MITGTSRIDVSLDKARNVGKVSSCGFYELVLSGENKSCAHTLSAVYCRIVLYCTTTGSTGLPSKQVTLASAESSSL